MNKYARLLIAGTLLSGCTCAHSSKESVHAEQLQHHRFVLTSVNGAPVENKEEPLALSFGEKLSISGNICNHFFGNGKISDNKLTVDNLAMTHMLCPDTQLNSLEVTFSKMLEDGAQVNLTGDQLTLRSADQTLVYKMADLMN